MKQSQAEVRKRHQLIIELLRKKQVLYVVDAAKELGVSELTIRRDFDHLLEKGFIKRFHGGAKLVVSKSEEPPVYESKGLINKDKKEIIAKVVTDYVHAGDTVFINAGTTAYEVIKHIKDKDITIVTNNAIACNLIDSECKANLISTGGEYNARNQSYSGILATELIHKMYASVCILGVNGITASDGISTPFYGETLINEEFLSRNKGLSIVIADGSKLGKVFCFNSASMDKIDILVTDSSADEEELKKLRATNTKVIIANEQ